jgi:hypothetical protein
VAAEQHSLKLKINASTWYKTPLAAELGAPDGGTRSVLNMNPAAVGRVHAGRGGVKRVQRFTLVWVQASG